jgi:hypothetical protein
MSTIETIHTPCKGCSFAVYNHNTQIDCGLGYIEKYKIQNIEVLEAYDEDKEFYVINGKKCIGYREDRWFAKWDMINPTMEEKVAKYKETNFLQYAVVINLKDLSFDQLQDLCKQISSCDVKPQKIIFIRYRDENLSFGYDIISNLLKDNNVGCSWRIQTMLDDTLSHKDILHIIAQNNVKNRFIVSITNYLHNLSEMIISVNKKIHEDLEQMIICSNKEKSCLIYSSAVYRFAIVHGNNILNNEQSYEII